MLAVGFEPIISQSLSGDFRNLFGLRERDMLRFGTHYMDFMVTMAMTTVISAATWVHARLYVVFLNLLCFYSSGILCNPKRRVPFT